MAPVARIIRERPNRENTIAVSEYENSLPEKFSLEDDDKFVLYGGGDGFVVSILRMDPSVDVAVSPELEHADLSNVTLYVLNTAVILWFNTGDLGLELPYQSIILHALRNELVEYPSIYLQVVSNTMLCATPREPTEYTPCVELQLYKTADENGHGGIFTPPVASTIDSIYEALSKCSAMNFDTDSEDEGPVEVPSGWISRDVALPTSGFADDLEEQDEDEQGGAGMDVDVGYGSIAGSKREANENGDRSSKKRR